MESSILAKRDGSTKRPQGPGTGCGGAAIMRPRRVPAPARRRKRPGATFCSTFGAISTATRTAPHSNIVSILLSVLWAGCWTFSDICALRTDRGRRQAAFLFLLLTRSYRNTKAAKTKTGNIRANWVLGLFSVGPKNVVGSGGSWSRDMCHLIPQMVGHMRTCSSLLSDTVNPLIEPAIAVGRDASLCVAYDSNGMVCRFSHPTGTADSAQDHAARTVVTEPAPTVAEPPDEAKPEPFVPRLTPLTATRLLESPPVTRGMFSKPKDTIPVSTVSRC